jgi:hypothetical protein
MTYELSLRGVLRVFVSIISYYSAGQPKCQADPHSPVVNLQHRLAL